MAYNPLNVVIKYTGNDKAMANSVEINITNRSHIGTLSTILATKPTAKNFSTIVSKARQILAPFVKASEKVKGLLADMQVHIKSNPTMPDGKDRATDRITEFTFNLSALLAITNLQVKVIQRPTWTRGSSEGDEAPQDYLSELLA